MYLYFFALVTITGIDRSDPRKEMIRSGRAVSPLPSPKRARSPLHGAAEQQRPQVTANLLPPDPDPSSLTHDPFPSHISQAHLLKRTFLITSSRSLLPYLTSPIALHLLPHLFYPQLQEGSSTDRAPPQAAVGLGQGSGQEGGGTGLNDGGVHTWLDVIKAIRQVRDGDCAVL